MRVRIVNIARYMINRIPRMDWGNWLFWSVVVWIGFNLIWIGAVSEHVKPWVGALIATLLAAAVYKFGPRIQEEEAEEEE
jgi:hypothetical protein